MFPINEFILWNNCPNNCEFCWLKKEKQQTYNEQLESIDLVYDIVKDLKDTHTLFVGGEIFAETDKLIKEKLLNLYDLTFKRMLDGYLDLCYFNTNILYKLDNLLLPVLDKMKRLNLLNKVHFTTSGDYYGIFANDNTAKLFYNNLHTLHKLYPEMLIYVNIILTDTFCNDILEDRFNIADYEAEHGVYVNTIPFIKFGNTLEAPTRNKFMQTILHLNEQMPGYGIKYCNNFLLNQNIILRQYSDGKMVNVSSDKSPCTHSENFTRCYSDSNECFVCDCGRLKELMEGQ